MREQAEIAVEAVVEVVVVGAAEAAVDKDEDSEDFNIFMYTRIRCVARTKLYHHWNILDMYLSYVAYDSARIYSYK
jgi:hypothetical protein